VVLGQEASEADESPRSGLLFWLPLPDFTPFFLPPLARTPLALSNASQRFDPSRFSTPNSFFNVFV